MQPFEIVADLIWLGLRDNVNLTVSFFLVESMIGHVMHIRSKKEKHRPKVTKLYLIRVRVVRPKRLKQNEFFLRKFYYSSAMQPPCSQILFPASACM